MRLAPVPVADVRVPADPTGASASSVFQGFVFSVTRDHQITDFRPCDPCLSAVRFWGFARPLCLSVSVSDNGVRRCK